jgi:hypothetical protein
MHPLASAVLITWRRNGAYALRLVGDLKPEQFVARPAGLPASVIMNHPAWVLSHLNVYAPICTAMLRGEAFEDPLENRYGQKSKVVADALEYPEPALLVAEYKRLHEEAEAALVEAGGDESGGAREGSTEVVASRDFGGTGGTVGRSVFADPNPLERWRAVHPNVGDMIVTLMVKHESGHLGQLSAWRRAMGLASVPM